MREFQDLFGEILNDAQNLYRDTSAMDGFGR